jgi:hypothetical protein
VGHTTRSKLSKILSVPWTGLDVWISRRTSQAVLIVLVLAAAKVDQAPSQRTPLFRAHDQPATDQSGVYTSAALRIPLNDDYRQRNSVQEFLKSLGMHLGKKAEAAKTGKIVQTMFT